MTIAFISLFPSIIDTYLRSSVLGRAFQNKLFSFKVYNPIDDADLPHRHVDDHPYGGGKGMILKVDVLAKTLERVKNDLDLTSLEQFKAECEVIVPAPAGIEFNQSAARELVNKKCLIFVCGRYEGIDQRFIELYATKIYTVGRYIVSGGELPALSIADATLRLVAGVLSEGSTEDESYTNGDNIEYPQYTRPVEFGGMSVPEVLLSGDHKAIREWRKKNSK
jgi:tRNA (guanine37-N1)-methyltransferase